MSDATVTIRDVSEATFVSDVVEASHTRPVVVDFWAAWCGPCRQLSPLLERAAAHHGGEVDVVKVDVDAAPGLARQFRIQGIPAVKAFRDGRVVAEFTGVQPETTVARFFANLLPSAADRLVQRAAAAAGGEQEELLREALAAEAGHPGATVALARLLAGRGDRDDALRLLARVPNDAAAGRLLAELRLADAVVDPSDLDALRAAAAAGDVDARLRLGRALAAGGDHAAALPVLIDAVADPATREEARKSVLELFAVRGDDELVRTWRPRLAAALF